MIIKYYKVIKTLCTRWNVSGWNGFMWLNISAYKFKFSDGLGGQFQNLTDIDFRKLYAKS